MDLGRCVSLVGRFGLARCWGRVGTAEEKGEVLELEQGWRRIWGRLCCWRLLPLWLWPFSKGRWISEIPVSSWKDSHKLLALEDGVWCDSCCRGAALIKM